MENQPGFSQSAEFASEIEAGRAYVLLINGREHNVRVDKVGGHYLFGVVALNKVLLLIDRKGAGKAIVKVVMPQDEKTAVGPGDELFHSVPVVVPSDSLKIRVKLDSIDVVEDPWRTFIGNDIVNAKGELVDEDKLLETLPALSGYYVKGRGFVRNPDVWATPQVQPTVGLKLVDDNSSSE